MSSLLWSVRVWRVGAGQPHPRREVLLEHLRQALAGQPAGPQEHPRDTALQPGGSYTYPHKISTNQRQEIKSDGSQKR